MSDLTSRAGTGVSAPNGALRVSCLIGDRIPGGVQFVLVYGTQFKVVYITTDYMYISRSFLLNYYCSSSELDDHPHPEG